jgi:transposase
MKICASCKEEKDETEFNKRRSSPDGLQYSCKQCTRSQYGKHYGTNKTTIRDNNLKRRQTVREQLDEYKKTLCCEKCGEAEPVCLDFHHVDGKDFEISSGVPKGYSWENILAEIQKCSVLCANCHRKVHAGVIGA